ncbi:hypothetical protein B0J18DRAFT_300899 [Chaetomium sp. MPI-SDFR-AT-0129]|nr:hypothetical protein B0J18DRAFT_300899 [Chaetomium sp. MPI-SDFR-AT-0129]
MKKFEFVDNTTIDRAARRRIRSHVATGRNAGKKLSRPSRKKMLTSGPRRARNPETTATLVQTRLANSVSPPPVESPCSAMSTLPAYLRQHCDSRWLAHFQGVVSLLGKMRHAPELDVALDYSSEPQLKFVQPLFFDEAYFHGAMAVFLSASHRSSPLPYTSSTISTPQEVWSARTRHLCLALRLVNTRLSGENAASNETLMAVLVLGMYERQQGEYGRGLVHLDGLQRMVQLRGGLAKFSESGPSGPVLARKVFR